MDALLDDKQNTYWCHIITQSQPSLPHNKQTTLPNSVSEHPLRNPKQVTPRRPFPRPQGAVTPPHRQPLQCALAPPLDLMFSMQWNICPELETHHFGNRVGRTTPNRRIWNDSGGNLGHVSRLLSQPARHPPTSTETRSPRLPTLVAAARSAAPPFHGRGP